MNSKHRLPRVALTVGVVLCLASAPAPGSPPERAGQGKGHGAKKAEQRHFSAGQHAQVRAYYEEEFRGGSCPPGLAKKRNGCLPPGQAKKQWRTGHPLPENVVVYDLPPALVLKIGVPPTGYKYVRVASDILMIAVGTKLVVDAIHDLGRL